MVLCGCDGSCADEVLECEGAEVRGDECGMLGDFDLDLDRGLRMPSGVDARDREGVWKGKGNERERMCEMGVDVGDVDVEFVMACGSEVGERSVMGEDGGIDWGDDGWDALFFMNLGVVLGDILEVFNGRIAMDSHSDYQW